MAQASGQNRETPPQALPPVPQRRICPARNWSWPCPGQGDATHPSSGSTRAAAWHSSFLLRWRLWYRQRGLSRGSELNFHFGDKRHDYRRFGYPASLSALVFAKPSKTKEKAAREPLPGGERPEPANQKCCRPMGGIRLSGRETETGAQSNSSRETVRCPCRLCRF